MCRASNRARIRAAVRRWAKRFNDGDFFTVSRPIIYSAANILTNTDLVDQMGYVEVAPGDLWETIGSPPSDRVWLLHVYGKPMYTGVTLEIARDEFLYSGTWLTSSRIPIYG